MIQHSWFQELLFSAKQFLPQDFHTMICSTRSPYNNLCHKIPIQQFVSQVSHITIDATRCPYKNLCSKTPTQQFVQAKSTSYNIFSRKLTVGNGGLTSRERLLWESMNARIRGPEHIVLLSSVCELNYCGITNTISNDNTVFLFTKGAGVLTTRSRDISKARDSELDFSNRSEIWGASRQQRCRDACQISEQYDPDNIQSCGFETSQDLVVKRLAAQWIETV